MDEGMQILVRCHEGQTETALLHQGQLWEYDRRSDDSQSLVGTVLLGKVERVLPDMKAAFVNIGRSLNGFLPIRESESFHAQNGKAPLITDNEVIVQVKKDEKGGKGAYLSRDIALAGQYMLLMPMSRFVGVSKRIEDPEEHAAAKALGKAIAANRFGVIVRHAALHARKEAVFQEAEELYERWLQATAHAEQYKAPSVLMRDLSHAEILKRDYSARYEVATFEENETGTQAMDGLWMGAYIDRQLKEALARKVVLAGGASLIIDEREALHTIDVNSGGNVVSTNGGSLALSQNLASIPEIARQIRLRNLSGILLIDFIDMDTADEREKVSQALQMALAGDRIKTVLHGFTSLGLMELTRKRTAPSLREMLQKPCDHCKGSGFVAD